MNMETKHVTKLFLLDATVEKTVRISIISCGKDKVVKAS